MNSMEGLINNTLEQILLPLKDGKVKEAMLYSLLAPGKRLRPIIFLKTIQAYGDDYRKYIDVACAIEMIHTYSLIHDDLPAMDNDDLRRGMKTCHKMFDEATAILAGDALLTHAFSVIAHSSLDNDKKVACIQILAEMSGQNGMIYGQQQDIYFENKQATISELENIHINKTGKLLIAPFTMAGVIVGESNLEALTSIGKTLGLAYQIQDDILDIVGDESVIGKKVGSDITNNKSTYVSLLGLDNANLQVEKYFNLVLENIYKLKINHGVLLEVVQTILKRVK